MELRLATFDDADLLLKWRNDAKTRASSRNKQEISKKEHEKWLKASLADSNRELYIAEINSIPVGTVRSDYDGQFYELSWTIAPEQRGKGIGKEMVSLITKKINKPVRAEVKKNNTASKRIAEYVGMTLMYEEEGILHFQRNK